MNTIAEAPKTTVKVVNWDTNFNNKMCNDAFVHIDLAPRQRPSRKVLDDSIIEICTNDNSHEPVRKRLYDLLFMPYQKVSCLLALCSHGMTDMQLANYMFDKHGPGFSWTTEICVYFYVPIL